MSQSKKSLIIILIGLLLIGVGFFIHLTNRYRITLIALGFIVQIFGMVFGRKRKLILIPILMLIFGSSLIFIDYLLVLNFNRLPVLAVRQKVSAHTKIYNAAFYRVWKCDISDKKMYVDKFYKSNFYCDSKELSKIDINEFLLHYEEKFETYKNEFVKIEGKISEIQGIKYLEMKAYTEEVDSLNGYVVFDDNVKLRFIFNGGYEKLSGYSLYDNVKVIGRVASLKKDENGQYVMTLKDSKMVSSNRYDDFQTIVEQSDECNDEPTIYYESDNQKYFFSCLNKISIKYNEEDVYELNYLLKENKLDLKDLYKKSKCKDRYEDGGSILYHYDDFNILKCNTTEGNNDIIFGSPSLEKTDKMCYTNTEPPESDEVVE